MICIKNSGMNSDLSNLLWSIIDQSGLVNDMSTWNWALEKILHIFLSWISHKVWTWIRGHVYTLTEHPGPGQYQVRLSKLSGHGELITWILDPSMPCLCKIRTERKSVKQCRFHFGKSNLGNFFQKSFTNFWRGTGRTVLLREMPVWCQNLVERNHWNVHLWDSRNHRIPLISDYIVWKEQITYSY